MNFADYVKHDAIGLASCVARGEVTADELLALALGQSARAQPKTNAICRMMESEARAQLQKPLTGPFAGVPFLIRAGKRLPVTATEVYVKLRKPPLSKIGGDGRNYFRFRLGPDIELSLGGRVKRPGPLMVPMPVELSAVYSCVRAMFAAPARSTKRSPHSSTTPERAKMAQPRPRNGRRRSPISLLIRPKSAGAIRPASSRTKMMGSKMKTKEPAYQRGLKG